MNVRTGTDRMPLVLAIETSCDETAVALVQGPLVLASEIASQIELHRPYGGVVPELASRNHNLTLPPLVRLLLDRAGVGPQHLEAVAATAGPGLASSLLIGNTFGKALSLALGCPFFAVNHLEGHLLSPCLGRIGSVPPSAALVVSGGHTLLVDVRGAGDYRLLGSTRDDAAGEAFDKVAKMLGLPYPGGPVIDRLAREGNPAAYALPRSMIGSGDFQFSFSGLKTAVHYLLPKIPPPMEGHLPDICASFQEAVIEVLVAKTMAAARATGRKLVTVSGGVSCNGRLRQSMTAACERAGLDLWLCSPGYGTDNAAMIGFVAATRLAAGRSGDPLEGDIDPNLRLESWAG